jgi:hypothetical protein
LKAAQTAEEMTRLLFGDVSPSGRLHFTVARDANDHPVVDCNAEAIPDH